MKGSRKAKILHVVGAMNRAGTETMLMNIYRNMDREKVQFDFVSYSQEEAHYDPEIINLGGRVIRLRKTNSIKQMYDVIKKYGPYDAVHSHTLFHSGIANLAARLAGVKIRIAHAHTTSDKSDRLLRKIYITCMRVLINRSSTNLLACSDQAGSYLFGEENLSESAYEFFPNVIDYSKFIRTRKREVSKFKMEEGLGNRIIIGHIGTFKQSKNHQFLLKIIKSLTTRKPTINLLLVGDGELRQQIQAEAKREGLMEQVKFVGVRDDIPVMLHSMDVFVFPSLYEGLGLVLLEAQASGVPCVVSEAIQPEADLGLGLVTKLSLAADPDIWVGEIIQHATGRERNVNKIIDSFENSAYSLTKGISTLMDIYKLNTGGAYEKDSNRLL